ncbi:unnamed protein product [Cyprideis torosa]|uniref:Uncharacterized protein n=1 Tax=Cyprideis torosa TaxID=163714 RepID=A0A7R8W8R4_9CRUS|nr:unnamed protein product [Cyprideis torosa]CAG0888871.1 unnamed protein product [Cyprideis torosa]
MGTVMVPSHPLLVCYLMLFIYESGYSLPTSSDARVLASPSTSRKNLQSGTATIGIAPGEPTMMIVREKRHNRPQLQRRFEYPQMNDIKLLNPLSQKSIFQGAIMSHEDPVREETGSNPRFEYQYEPRPRHPAYPPPPPPGLFPDAYEQPHLQLYPLDPLEAVFAEYYDDLDNVPSSTASSKPTPIARSLAREEGEITLQQCSDNLLKMWRAECEKLDMTRSLLTRPLEPSWAKHSSSENFFLFQLFLHFFQNLLGRNTLLQGTNFSVVFINYDHTAFLQETFPNLYNFSSSVSDAPYTAPGCVRVSSSDHVDFPSLRVGSEDPHQARADENIHATEANQKADGKPNRDHTGGSHTTPQQQETAGF